MTTLISSKTQFMRHADGILNFVARLFTFINAVINASGALEVGKMPAAETIERLGLSVENFSCLQK
ncbi:hypothetical protein ABDF71_27125 [Ochrobactrum sp. WV_118_8]|nr:hypothetical protein [Brucella intermedia]